MKKSYHIQVYKRLDTALMIKTSCNMNLFKRNNGQVAVRHKRTHKYIMYVKLIKFSESMLFEKTLILFWAFALFPVYFNPFIFMV